MSNGYLIAAGNDVAAAHEISDGFGLEVIDAATMADPDNAASALAGAANVGLLISSASASDAHYVAVLRAVVQHLQRVQLILVDADARAAFPFLPETWPAMSLDDARGRAAELVRRRDAPPEGESDHAAPIPAAPEPEAPASAPEASTPEPEAPPHQAEAPAEQDAHAPIDEAPQAEAEAGDDAVAERAPPEDTITQAEPEQEHAPSQAEAPPQPAEAEREEEGAPPLASAETGEAPPPAPPQAEPPPQMDQPAPAPPPAGDLSAPNDSPAALGGAHAPPEASLPTPAPMPMPAPSAPSPASSSATTGAPRPKTRGRADASEATAPADATAFAPKKLRRGAPELVQVTIHQPKDLKAVIQAAKKANPSAEPAPQGVHIGDVALGASIGVALETHGATCDGAMQRRPWRGDPIDFSFSVEAKDGAEDGAKKAVFIARVFIDDAQIGVIGFTRPISGPKKKPAQTGDGARLKRHKRVFLSYASTDRETVSVIATAYQAAGVPHFWDRASLKSGEEWSPRLRKEIDRADLFHLCWSKSAAQSQWVEKETEHALTRSRRSKGKNPDITVQMLDGPPWAPHPRELDAINFDDFVRAAIVGYARGDGSS